MVYGTVRIYRVVHAVKSTVMLHKALYAPKSMYNFTSVSQESQNNFRVVIDDDKYDLKSG